jgi:hypothetical protein
MWLESFRSGIDSGYIDSGYLSSNNIAIIDYFPLLVVSSRHNKAVEDLDPNSQYRPLCI